MMWYGGTAVKVCLLVWVRYCVSVGAAAARATCSTKLCTREAASLSPGGSDVVTFTAPDRCGF